MKKYFNKYNSVADYETASPKWPEVSYIEETEEVKYEEKIIDYSTEYFTTVALSNGNICFDGYKKLFYENLLSYSTDEGKTWSNFTRANTVLVNVGDRVMWKGKYASEGMKGLYSIATLTTATTAQFDVEGNAMSLILGDNFQDKKSLNGYGYAFQNLFRNIPNIVSAKNLSLPATTLAENCYSYMFYGCTSLTTAPQLPATTLANSCYDSMFNGCTSLTTAPELLATTLGDYCYKYMFSGCTSLTEAPELPATTLAKSCYDSMFKGCTSLTTAPSVLPATALANSCYYSMFESCRSLTTAPELPATTLTNNCYNGMFFFCTSLTSIKCLATDISATDCTSNWTYNVPSTGTFTKAASMNDWTTGANGIPRGWTVVDA